MLKRGVRFWYAPQSSPSMARHSSLPKALRSIADRRVLVLLSLQPVPIAKGWGSFCAWWPWYDLPGGQVPRQVMATFSARALVAGPDSTHDAGGQTYSRGAPAGCLLGVLSLMPERSASLPAIPVGMEYCPMHRQPGTADELHTRTVKQVGRISVICRAMDGVRRLVVVGSANRCYSRKSSR